jgi:iron complex outermembrane recepter protein
MAGKNLLLTLGLFTGIVFAQEPQLETVVVTAAKREQNLQDVPISMNVIPMQQLESFNTNTFDELQYSVPNLFVGKSNANNGIYLRGFGSAPNNPAFDQTVSMYQDGIYAGRVRQFMAPFFDVERIEVLRGPQGALLGKNTAAGAISVVTANPTDELDAAVTASYNFDRPGVDSFMHLSGPLSGDLSARLAVKYTKLDGYIHNIATGQDDVEVDQKQARLTLLYQPSEAVTINGKLQYDDFRTDGNNTLHYSPPTLRLADVLETAIDVKNTPGAFGRRAYDEQDGVNVSVTADVDVGTGYTLTSVTGYTTFEAGRLGPPGYDSAASNFRAEYLEIFDQRSQEIRLLSPTSGPLDFIVGVYADDADYSMFNHSQYQLFVATGLTVIDFRQKSTTYSGYVNATWNAADKLDVLLSGRYTRNEKIGDYMSTVTGQPLSPVQGSRTLPTTTIDESHFDPSVTLQFRPSDTMMLYASYAEGSKSGAFESLTRSVVAQSFATEAETSTNYEIGAKTALLDWLTLDVAAFLLRFDNLQVAAFDPILLQSITRNAAKAESEGVEATFTAQLAPRFSISGAVSYLDATYTDFPGAACTFRQPPPCAQATNNIAGYPIPFSSKWSGQLRFDYSQPISGTLELGLDGTVDYRSEYYIDQGVYNPNFGLQESYAKYNARVAIGSADDRWSVALVGKNLTDEITATQSFFWPLQPPVSAGVAVAEPRTVALQGAYRF